LLGAKEKQDGGNVCDVRARALERMIAKYCSPAQQGLPPAARPLPPMTCFLAHRRLLPSGRPFGARNSAGDAPWLSSLDGRSGERCFGLCGREPVRYLSEAGWAASADLSRRIFERRTVVMVIVRASNECTGEEFAVVSASKVNLSP
jgi:hypothetical protein